ncbi:hypothetical protein MMC22_004693 [Lobaria immixta]|nr:hypothetical protein [Lobaria immixta]
MHIIVLLLGLKVALFGSFTYSLPIAGSIPHAGFDKYPMNVKKRSWFGNSGDFLGDASGDAGVNFFVASCLQKPQEFSSIGLSVGCVLPPNSSGNVEGGLTSPKLRLQPQNPRDDETNVRAPPRPVLPQSPNLPVRPSNIQRPADSFAPSYDTQSEPSYQAPSNGNPWDGPRR